MEGDGEIGGGGGCFTRAFFGGRVGEDVELVGIMHFWLGGGVVWCGVV